MVYKIKNRNSLARKTYSSRMQYWHTGLGPLRRRAISLRAERSKSSHLLGLVVYMSLYFSIPLLLSNHFHDGPMHTLFIGRPVSSLKHQDRDFLQFHLYIRTGNKEKAHKGRKRYKCMHRIIITKRTHIQ